MPLDVLLEGHVKLLLKSMALLHCSEELWLHSFEECKEVVAEAWGIEGGHLPTKLAELVASLCE